MEDAASTHENGRYDNHRESQLERLGAMRRTLAKVLNPTTRSNNFHDDEKPHSHSHPRVEELVNTVVWSLSKESMQYLRGAEGQAAMACVIRLLAHAMSRFIVTEEARHAIRVSAQEATTGLYNGLHLRVQELLVKVPRSVLYIGLFVLASYAALLAVGLLLCLWRFSLYGLAQESK